MEESPVTLIEENHSVKKKKFPSTVRDCEHERLVSLFNNCGVHIR